MPYAQIVDYNEAVQNPRTAFTDPELRGGKVAENSLGLPLVMSGGFALTYMVATRAGNVPKGRWQGRAMSAEAHAARAAAAADRSARRWSGPLQIPYSSRRSEES